MNAAASLTMQRRGASLPAGALGHAASAALGQAAGLWAGHRGCCLTFHRAVPATEWASHSNPGFHLDAEFLESLVLHLRQTGWDIVSLDEALRRVGDPHAKRFVNFSVDDCYVDTAELVVPLFRRHNAPVTLFVTTGIPDRVMRLPFSGLETIVHELDHVVDAERDFPLQTQQQRRAAYAAIGARWDSSGDADGAYLGFCERHGYDPVALDDRHRMTWPMLEALRDEPLVEIGGHTVMHRRISALDPAAALDELAGCRERLENVLGRQVRHFAFPYGRATDCGPRDFALAQQAGFASASTTRKGLVSRGADPFRLPRNTLNGLHRRLSYVYAHLSGASGLATRIMGRG